MDQRLSLKMEQERGRNKELLEASLSWLCEMETLKTRQESLVLGALSLGDSETGCPSWGDVGPARSSRDHEQLTLRRQLNRLQGAPSLLMLALQQQLSDLRLDDGPTWEQNTEEDLDSPSASSSGFYEQSESLSPPPRSSSSPNLASSCGRPRSLDAYMLDWDAHKEPTKPASIPRSFSAPYPPLEGIAEGIEEEEDDDEDSQWVTSEKLLYEANFAADAEGKHPVKIDEDPTEEDIHHAMRVESYILTLLQRRNLTSTAPSDSDEWHGLHVPTYPRSDPRTWLTQSEEPPKETTHSRYHMTFTDSQNLPASQRPKDQPLRTPHVHTCCNHTCVPITSSPSECHDPPQSQNWAVLRPVGPKERWSTLERRRRTASRSQSEENCVLSGRSIQPEQKYFTVGRDVGRKRGDEFHSPSQRLWSSSADLSQEEEDEGLVKEQAHDYRHLHLTAQTFRVKDTGLREASGDSAAPPEGSDSSLSETFSPASSSESSDSDENGGLVWPQQLPPRLFSSTSTKQSSSNGLVKIKASQALKKKIMRFRSGSLKLMTTV